MDLCALAISHRGLKTCHLLRRLCDSPHPRSPRHDVHPLDLQEPPTVVHRTHYLTSVHLLSMVPLGRRTLPPLPRAIPLLLVRSARSRHDRSWGLHRARSRECMGASHRERGRRSHRPCGNSRLPTSQGQERRLAGRLPELLQALRFRLVDRLHTNRQSGSNTSYRHWLRHHGGLWYTNNSPLLRSHLECW